jgi:hypothetical protein
MTLPSSGALKFSDIQGEFGGANPISLSEYYAGGSYVPSGTSGVNGSVPSSGALSMSKFYGTTKFTGVTHTYNSGSGNEVVPTGSQHLTVYVSGGGGKGGAYYYGGDLDQQGGGGAGAGGTAIKTIPISPSDWGTNLAYVVGAANIGNSTVTGLAMSLTGNHGNPGGNASSGNPGSPGTGGTASGGDSNVTGGDGSPGDSSGGGGIGGASAYGVNGGSGANVFATQPDGSAGQVKFVWS